MPTYFVYHRSESLTREQKQGIAKSITDAHVESTNAPRFFVKVIFRGCGEDELYSGGEPDQAVVQVSGKIRAGREVELVQELIKNLYRKIVVHAPEDKYKVEVALSERPSEYMAIEGAFAPTPGSLLEQKARDDGRIPDEAKFH